MSVKARDDFFKEVKAMLFGPNPLEKYCQENGEEILYGDSPLNTYVTGILFPCGSVIGDESVPDEDDNANKDAAEELLEPEAVEGQVQKLKKSEDPGDSGEVSQINNYKPSGMGITVAIPNNPGMIRLRFEGGCYTNKKGRGPRIQTVDGNRRVVEFDDMNCWYRHPIDLTWSIDASTLPTEHVPRKELEALNKELQNKYGIKVVLSIIFRMEKDGNKIYTFTVLNKSESKQRETTLPGQSTPDDPSKCIFQAGFSISCDAEFSPFPTGYNEHIDDEDYQLNALLYKDIKTYALGHGCAATWKEDDLHTVKAEAMPFYDVKQISPAEIDGLTFSMKKYANDKDATISELSLLCDRYQNWINETFDIEEKSEYSHFLSIIATQKKRCLDCLRRMRAGVDELNGNPTVWRAFSLSNRAMLLQQLHYNLPTTNVHYDSDLKNFKTDDIDDVREVNYNNEDTWYNRRTEENPNGIVYGQWRPFQIAFLLMNLVAMNDKDSIDHGIVDLIWFPTGGGKTEAYLGLTAYSIFLRRLKNPNNAGTAVLMRYTLRLLTQQQFQRAASLICAMEVIRTEHSDELGTKRITIGMWVGNNVTPAEETGIVDKLNSLHAARGKQNRRYSNISPMIRCPWCGTTMNTIVNEGRIYTPGYEPGGRNVYFSCANNRCAFHMTDTELLACNVNPELRHDMPIVLFDDSIYKNPPSLLFGTVDKFATIPFRSESKRLFGVESNYSPPELIIQDELHLISGPLGSCVGMYETLIDWLCRINGSAPKVIASTATISHAAEQCNALYACKPENVFQFPVQGISYKYCFFAKENDKKPARRYVGIYGSNKQAETTISTFATLAFAAEDLPADERDPYWTNLAYFNSIKELGQISTWCLQDIKERLEYTLYSKRLITTSRRHLSESNRRELSSQVPNDEIPTEMDRLGKEYRTVYSGIEDHALDICLATNMIQVGLDIPRLGLMTVNGQPKSISEYIQATSRIGRSNPGIVFVIYNTSKSRDRSYYEQFQSQHAKLYYHVDPASVTPFSKPMRDRALPAIVAAMYRHKYQSGNNSTPNNLPTNDQIEQIASFVKTRVSIVDYDEASRVERQTERLFEKWRRKNNWYGYGNMGNFLYPNRVYLLYNASVKRPIQWGPFGWPAPTSMRNVDASCILQIIQSNENQEDDNDV